MGEIMQIVYVRRISNSGISIKTMGGARSKLMQLSRL